MENKIDIKKEWEAPSFEKLEVIKTLGGANDTKEGEAWGANEAS